MSVLIRAEHEKYEPGTWPLTPRKVNPAGSPLVQQPALSKEKE